MKKTNALSPLQQLPLELNLQEMEVILQGIPHLPQAQNSSVWGQWKTTILKYLSGLALLGLSVFCLWQFTHLPTSTSSIALAQQQPEIPDPGTSNTSLLPTLEVDTKDTVRISTPPPAPRSPKTIDAAASVTEPALQPRASQPSEAIPAAPTAPRKEAKSPGQRASAPARVYPPSPLTPREMLTDAPDTVIKKGLFGDYVIDENAHDFSTIPLAKLRRVLRKNLLRDGLISGRQDTVDLYLATSTIYLNGEELMPDKVLTYRKIAEEFQLGSGPMRHVHMTPKGFAVGDFGAEYFHGASIGTFRLKVE